MGAALSILKFIFTSKYGRIGLLVVAVLGVGIYLGGRMQAKYTHAAQAKADSVAVALQISNLKSAGYAAAMGQKVKSLESTNDSLKERLVHGAQHIVHQTVVETVHDTIHEGASLTGKRLSAEFNDSTLTANLICILNKVPDCSLAYMINLTVETDFYRQGDQLFAVVSSPDSAVHIGINTFRYTLPKIPAVHHFLGIDWHTLGIGAVLGGAVFYCLEHRCLR